MGLSEFEEWDDVFLVSVADDTSCSTRSFTDFSFSHCRFEAFNEPWKKSFDTDTQKWESQWGLMDENRNVKSGLKIPDCGGMTIEKPFV